MNNTTDLPTLTPTLTPTSFTPQVNYIRHVIITVLTIAWTIYVSFYNSRVFGLIVTWVLNRAVKYGHFSIGKLFVMVF